MADFNILLPNINSQKYSVDEKFKLLKNYLTELCDILTVALSDVSTGNLSPELKSQIEKIGETETVTKKLEQDVLQKVSRLKSQIIRTATEIRQETASAIAVSEEEILSEVSTDFLAISDFGIYQNQTSARFDQTDESISLVADKTEEIETDLSQYKVSNDAALEVKNDEILADVERVYFKKTDGEELEERVASSVSQTAENITETFNTSLTRLEQEQSSLGGDVADFISSLEVYIRRGELESGVYGIEIGRSDSGVKARFTSDRLSFFQGENEVAYISGSNLYITRAQVLDYLEIGNTADGFFTFDVTANGLEVRWSYGN